MARPPRTQYQEPIQHPWGQHPYAPRPQIDPRYVGPQWAAPAPRPVQQAAPPRKGGGIWKVLLTLLLLLILVPIAVVGALALWLSQEIPSLPTTNPVATASAPVPTGTVGPLAKPDLQAAQKTLKGGTCTEVASERNLDEYLALRDGGSALHLRGKVAMLHVELGGGESAWPKTITTRIDEAALLSQKFYLDQAKRYGIKDLVFDVIPWPLHSASVQLPVLTTNSHDLLDPKTERALRDQAEAGIEQAFGSSLESVIESYRAKGYESVGFLIYLPASTQARDFAWRSSKSDRNDEPEIGILFPRTDVLDHLSVVVAHEGMHLFGADDLYRMRNADKGDAHDVMGEYCTGFKLTTVDDTTAYAIGWKSTPPARSYSIVDQ
jgi:hypothetical protein